jgi:hypothetical protein
LSFVKCIAWNILFKSANTAARAIVSIYANSRFGQESALAKNPGRILASKLA